MASTTPVMSADDGWSYFISNVKYTYDHVLQENTSCRTLKIQPYNSDPETVNSNGARSDILLRISRANIISLVVTVAKFKADLSMQLVSHAAKFQDYQDRSSLLALITDHIEACKVIKNNMRVRCNGATQEYPFTEPARDINIFTLAANPAFRIPNLTRAGAMQDMTDGQLRERAVKTFDFAYAFVAAFEASFQPKTGV